MACTTCGKKAKARSQRGVGAPRSAPRSLSEVSDPNYLWVTYKGPHGNHFIPSPTRKVKHYKFGGNGDVVKVHIDDLRARPDLFEAVPVAVDEPAPVPALLPEMALLLASQIAEMEVDDEDEFDTGEGEEEEGEEEEGEEAAPDDLSLIKGIGPSRLAVLADAGIDSFAGVVELGGAGLADLVGVTLSVAERMVAEAESLLK